MSEKLYRIRQESLEKLANATRRKCGVNEELSIDEMCGEIENLQTGVDTSKDTVIPEALAHGFTAHDASGKPITGSFVNPYNANTAGDTVTPETLHQGVTAHDASGKPITGAYKPSGGSGPVCVASVITNGAHVTAGKPVSSFTLKST